MQLSELEQCRVKKIAQGFNTTAQDSNPGSLSRELLCSTEKRVCGSYRSRRSSVSMRECLYVCMSVCEYVFR